MPPKAAASKVDAPVLKLNRKLSANTSSNGVEAPLDPDAPREGRLASLKTRGTTSARGSAPKIVFKPKIVQRRKRDGASDSLLFTPDDGDEGPSGAQVRRAERGRGRGRGRGSGRVEAPLLASGPFAQGPAQGPTASSHVPSRSTPSVRVPAQPQTIRPSTTAKREPRTKEDIEQEANLDDAGMPMRNLLRMQNDTVDFWAPITTARVERSLKDTPIAQPEAEGKTVKVKKEAEELDFIDVKTEPTESTLTSRLPSLEPPGSHAADDIMNDMPQTAKDDIENDDDMDITLPGVPTVSPLVEETKTKSEKKKALPKVLSGEEAEEKERAFADIATLRLSLTEETDSATAEPDQLFFIQLPDVLPLWKPGQDDDQEDGFMKHEDVKEDIVEIDQKTEDSRRIKAELSETGAGSASASEMPQASEVDKKEPAPPQPASGPTGANEPLKRKKKKQKPSAFPPPEGLLGQLHIHKSGRMSCTWGGITFDVGTGSDCGFLQEVVVVNHKVDQKAWSLGRVTSRVMLTPNLDELLGHRG